MQIRSDSFEHRQRLPAEFAAGQATARRLRFRAQPQSAPGLGRGAGGHEVVRVAVHRSRRADRCGEPGAQIPADQPRTDFTHWAMVDIPADVREIAAGSCSDGVVPHGKPEPAVPAGSSPGPQRLHRLVCRRSRPWRRLARLRRPVPDRRTTCACIAYFFRVCRTPWTSPLRPRLSTSLRLSYATASTRRLPRHRALRTCGTAAERRTWLRATEAVADAYALGTWPDCRPVAASRPTGASRDLDRLIHRRRAPLALADAPSRW